MTPCARHRLGAWFFLLISWLCSCSRQAPPVPGAFFFVEHVRSSEDTFKRADLSSLRDEGYLAAPVTVRADTRISLTPPLPSRLDFTVDLPSDPVIRFAIATATRRKLGDRSPVVFRILLKDENRRETVFREVVRPRRRNQWLDREVRLDSWLGSTIRLTFETKLLDSESGTSAERGELFPLWANPVLASFSGGGNASNIILISVDCLRADHVGVYGYPRATTPHIDRFAESGVVFETALSTAGSTHPTHMSIFTGLLPSFHGATPLRELSRSVPYLSEILRQASYQTDAVVTGAYLSQHFGFNRGFNTYRYASRLRAGDAVDMALDVLERSGEDKHFLFLHLIDAHWPYDPPPEFRERFRTSAPNVPHLLNKVLDHEPPDDPDEIDQIVALYDAEIANADQELGRFFDELKARGLYDRSLIILFADHGEAFYEHGRWQHTVALYEEVIRIPLIVKWPGNLPTGRVTTPVSQVGIFPTVLEEAGLDFSPLRATGLKQFVDGSGTPSEPGAVVSECVTTWKPEVGAIRTVSFRTDTTKYIATFRTTAESTIAIGEILDEELYDLARDPDEMQNLLEGPGMDSGPYQEQLRAYLREAREFERGRMGEEVILDDAIQDQLKALGYIDPQYP